MPSSSESYVSHLRVAAESHGFELISTEAPTGTSPVFLRCRRGHTLSPQRSSVLSPKWAGHCEDCMFEDRLVELNAIAKRQGGRIVTEERKLRTTQKIEIECANGHRSMKRVYSIQQGTWCARCHFNQHPSRPNKQPSKEPLLERVRAIAKQKGGRCLSKECLTARDKLEFECRHGHRWIGPAQTVLYQQAWCNVCAMLKRPKAITLEKLRHYASERGGTLLTQEYRRNDIKLDWLCQYGHEFKRTWMSMRNGSCFCTVCGDREPG